MSRDNELDEILASLQKDKQRLNDLLNPEPITPPKAKIEPPAPPEPSKVPIEIPIEKPKPVEKPAPFDEVPQPAPQKQAKKVEPIEPIEPPKPKKKQESKATQQKKAEKKKKAPAPKPKKKAKEKKVKNGVSKYAKTTFSKDIKKTIKIIVAIIVAIAIAVAGGFVIASKAKYGYIKAYEKQYGIDFPKGIQEEFCDEYGKNQGIRGALVIEGEKQFVESESTNNPYLDNESKIDEDAQFIAIKASKDDFGAEKVYSTSKGYTNASQEIVFNTLFEEQRYQVIACYYTNTKKTNGDSYIYPYNIYGNMSQRSFVEFEDKIKSRELYDTGYKFSYYDKFISVAIDSDFMEDYVFVIVGVKVDDKMKKYTDATDNKKVHYPQSYYTANDMHNPYRFAKKWQPEMLNNAE